MQTEYAKKAISMVSAKWKIDILLAIQGAGGFMRFGDIKRALPMVSIKMVSSQVKALEADGLLSRKHHHEIPPRVDYTLTKIGHSVIEGLNMMGSIYKSFERQPAPAPVASTEPQLPKSEAQL